MNLLDRWGYIIVKYRFYVVILVTIITISLAYGSKNLKRNPNVFQGQLPKSIRGMQEDARATEIFEDVRMVYLIIVSKDTIFQYDILKIISEVSDDLKDIDEVIKVWSPETLSPFHPLGEGEIDTMPLLSTLPKSNVEILKLKEIMNSNPIFYERFISSDNKVALVRVDFEHGAIPSANEFNIINQEIYEVISKYETDEVKIYPYGFPIVIKAIDDGTVQESNILAPVAVLIIFALIFASLTLADALTMIPFILFSIAWTMGLMGWLKVSLTPLSASIPVILIAIGSSYHIHYCIWYRKGIELKKNRLEATVYSLRHIASPVFIAALTSIMGFATLLVFKIVSIKEFGIFCAIGIASYIVLFFTLELAMQSYVTNYWTEKGTIIGKLKTKIDKPFNGMIEAIIRFCLISSKHQRKTLAALIIFALLAYAGFRMVEIGSNTAFFLPRDHRVRLASNILLDNFEANNFFSMMIDLESTGGVNEPTNLDKVDSLLSFAESIPLVGYTISEITYLKWMNQASNDGDYKDYRLPDRRELISQYILLQEMDDQEILETLVSFDMSKIRLDFFVKADHNREVEEAAYLIKAKAEELFPGNNYLFGENWRWVLQNKYIVPGKIMSIILALVLVCFIVSIRFRSIVAGLISIIPFSIAIYFCFSLMGVFHIGLDISSCTITSLMVGIAPDFAIHLLTQIKREVKINSTMEEAVFIATKKCGRPVLLDALSNTLGFSAFLFAFLLPVRNFGMLIAITMMTSAIVTLTIIPVSIVTLKPKFLQR